MNNIIFKGVLSTTLDGLLISELPPITKPAMRTRQTAIDGRDGSIVEKLGYQSYNKTIIIGLHGEYDINKIIKYFSGEGEVVFSNEPDKVYKASVVDKIDFERLVRYRKAKVTFLVQPFKYKKDEAMKETEIATASGSNVVLNDSASGKIFSLNIYGTIPLKSVSGAMSVEGANLIENTLQSQTINGLTFTVNADKSITINGKATTYTERRLCDNFVPADGQYYISGCPSGGAMTKYHIRVWCNKASTHKESDYGNGATFTFNKDTDIDMAVYIRVEAGITIPNLTFKPMLNEGSTAMPYQPYIAPQQLITTTSNELCGVPVASGGNYTDANGQQWICDEFDFKRGVLIKRVGKVDLGTLTWIYATNNAGGRFMADGSSLGFKYGVNAISSKYEISNGRAIDKTIYINDSYYGANRIVVFDADYTDASAFKSSMSGVMFFFELETSTETPLSAEEIEAFNGLHTNSPTTIITNEDGADVKVGYFKPFEVFNEGLESSRPLMLLKGSGTVEISVNGIGTFAYTFPEGENEVYIDSEKEDAYLGSVLKNRNMNGEFPILIPKTNKIEWSGNVESIEILPRSRWL